MPDDMTVNLIYLSSFVLDYLTLCPINLKWWNGTNKCMSTTLHNTRHILSSRSSRQVKLDLPDIFSIFFIFITNIGHLRRV